MSETIEGLRNKPLNWKDALKANLGKTKVMVSSSITKDGMSKWEVDQCWVAA